MIPPKQRRRPKLHASGTFKLAEGDMDRKLELEGRALWEHRLNVVWDEVGFGVITALWFGVPALVNGVRCGFAETEIRAVANHGEYLSMSTVKVTAWSWQGAIGGAVLGVIFGLAAAVAVAGICSAWDSFEKGPLARIRSRWAPSSLQKLRDKVGT